MSKGAQMSPLNRRTFLQVACCAAHSVAIAKVATADVVTQSLDDMLEFTCAAIDLAPSNVIVPKPYSGGGTIKLEGGPVTITPTPYGTAFRDQRWTVEDGNTPDTDIITLGVYFDGGTDQQHTAVHDGGMDWLKGDLSKRFVLDFETSREESQIRISFEKNKGNWSEVGRKCKSIPISKATMNFVSASHRGVIRHEWGHAFGLQHEHQHPGTFTWNEAQVIADTKSMWGWNESAARSNIIKQFDKTAECIGDPEFNEKSIMLYPILPTWSTPSFSSTWMSNISKRDLACLSAVYEI